MAEAKAPEKADKLTFQSTVELSGGVKMPMIGLGTYEYARTMRHMKGLGGEEKSAEEKEEHSAEAKRFIAAIKHAVLKAGYRHIDSAIAYDTESLIGDTLKEIFDSEENDITRESIHITTKFPMRVKAENLRDSVLKSLANLKTDYIDLFLIHSPHTQLDKESQESILGGDVVDVYRQLLEFQKEGKIKSVGVSNFGVRHLEILEGCGLPKPSLNQVEMHCFWMPGPLIEYAAKNGIPLEAWSPMAKAQDFAKNNEILAEIGKKHGKSWAQIMCRYLLQKGIPILPKSVNPGRIEQNRDLFDFELTSDEMAQLDELNKLEKKYTGFHPLNVKWGELDAIKAYVDGKAKEGQSE